MAQSIIFDFDGTIADSFELFIETLRQLIGRPLALTTEEILHLRGLPIQAIMLELGIKPWQIPVFVTKGRREISKQYNSVSIFDGMHDVIEQLSDDGHELYILSTNSKDVILTFLERYNLTNRFTEIYADIGLTGKSPVINKLLKHHAINPSDAIYIGDEVRDIEAAHKANISCLSVSWGYATSEALSSAKPEFLASNVSEITPLINQ